MWCRYLLSAFVLLHLAMLPASGQLLPCNSEASTDSAINRISHHYSYTSENWQRAFDSLLADCPNLDQAWQLKAMPNIKIGNWQGCFANLERAVAINPKRWLAYQAFLKCIFAKDYRGALLDFKRCDTVVPGAGVMDHSYDFYRGLCYLGMKDYKAGLFWLKKDADNQAGHFGAANVHYVCQFYLGLAYFLNGKYDSAEASLRQCLTTFPQYPEPAYYLGLTLSANGKKADAQLFYQTAKASLLAGYNSNEDQEFYVNYPYAIAMTEVEEQLNPH